MRHREDAFAQDTGRLARFEPEARVSLNHRNITRTSPRFTVSRTRRDLRARDASSSSVVTTGTIRAVCTRSVIRLRPSPPPAQRGSATLDTRIAARTARSLYRANARVEPIAREAHLSSARGQPHASILSPVSRRSGSGHSSSHHRPRKPGSTDWRGVERARRRRRRSMTMSGNSDTPTRMRGRPPGKDAPRLAGSRCALR